MAREYRYGHVLSTPTDSTTLAKVWRPSGCGWCTSIQPLLVKKGKITPMTRVQSVTLSVRYKRLQQLFEELVSTLLEDYIFAPILYSLNFQRLSKYSRPLSLPGSITGYTYCMYCYFCCCPEHTRINCHWQLSQTWNCYLKVTCAKYMIK